MALWHVPERIRPLMETSPVKGHFLSMYVPEQRCNHIVIKIQWTGRGLRNSTKQTYEIHNIPNIIHLHNNRTFSKKPIITKDNTENKRETRQNYNFETTINSFTRVE